MITSQANNLVSELLRALNESKIDYCHWKSNATIDRSASGDNDLDLLVKRSDVQQFQKILLEFGFKECLVDETKQLPGVQDFLGYDPLSDKFIHVHAHYQLIFGHDLSKNYSLPIEIPYIKSAKLHGLFKIPAPEFELVVFVIRMIIKHSTWDTILMHEGSLSATEKQELVHLEANSDRTEVEEIIKRFLPFIEVELFDECLRALYPNCSVITRINTGWRLEHRLIAQTRRTLRNDLLVKRWRQISFYFQWHVLRKRQRFRLANGGVLVAIIGGDGAGKTTAAADVYKLLSSDFEVQQFHMGKPNWSFLTIVVRGMLKIGTMLGFYPFMRGEIKYTKDEGLRKFPGYPWAIREVCTGRDRYLTYIKARRFATNGGIVICDRYPLPQIKLMDGPQVEWMSCNHKKNWFIQAIIAQEKKCYQRIMEPDLLIVLRADPEIAVRRKTDEDASSVFSRSMEIWEIDWNQTPARVIDANQTKVEVISEIKKMIWSQL